MSRPRHAGEAFASCGHPLAEFLGPVTEGSLLARNSACAANEGMVPQRRRLSPAAATCSSTRHRFLDDTPNSHRRAMGRCRKLKRLLRVREGKDRSPDSPHRPDHPDAESRARRLRGCAQIPPAICGWGRSAPDLCRMAQQVRGGDVSLQPMQASPLAGTVLGVPASERALAGRV
jgi:hypothetical protein